MLTLSGSPASILISLGMLRSTSQGHWGLKAGSKTIIQLKVVFSLIYCSPCGASQNLTLLREIRTLPIEGITGSEGTLGRHCDSTLFVTAVTVLALLFKQQHGRMWPSLGGR